MTKHGKLILLRHGQSMWNERNLFTGWVDIPLSPKGIIEAGEAGKKIAELPIDVVFVSALIRAQTTALLAMAHHSSRKIPLLQHPKGEKMHAWSEIHNPAAHEECIPMIAAWQLNERMYGKLQGLNKKDTAEKYGEEQVIVWRRSFDEAPPGGESLAMTAKRSIPYFEEYVMPYLREGKSVFICAHGNSLRSIIMDIEKWSKEQILQFELSTGEPRVYEYDGNNFKLYEC